MVTSIVLAVFIRQVAVVIAILIFAAAGYNIKKKFFDKEIAQSAVEYPLYRTMDEEANVAAIVTTESQERIVMEGTVMLAKTEVR